ncbi:hypothetical protein A7D00_0336 [Trichophyton violaceum]|uniref:Uncharacterized protein n=1 Tax=Trichophyton violaceum TaxID=34388 RepID=A0A178FQF6_TRIVO|nr:hypothetical protein A7D00_0336 [Trichophyton violaceum]
MPQSELKCNICPRKPKFSDVSHLLTHVSSKGHLSHYFKLQVRSQQEPQAGELLAAYDRWYKQNKLANLLSDRMLAKEARTGKGSRASNRSSLPVAFSHQPSTTVAPPTNQNAPIISSPRRGSLPSFLDPQLSQNYYTHDAQGNRLSGRTYSPMSVSSMINPNPQPGYGWHHQTQYQPQATLQAPSTQTVWKDGDETESDGEESPLMARRMRRGSLLDPSLRFVRQSITPDPFIDDDAAYEYDDQEDHSQRGSDEMTRLKGVFWPGMDIFDSATEEMRRKRNQKKDGSIIKQMEETSESVEPTELVFSPNGTLRKQRVISGMVDDSSPLKGETPIPKTKVTRPRRRPMSQLSGNVQMAQNRYKMRIREQSRAAQLEKLSQQALMLGGHGDPINYPPLDTHRHVFFNTSKYGLKNSANTPYYGPFKPPSTEAYRGKENIDPMFCHERNVQKQQYYYGYPSQNENDNYGYSMNPLSYAASQQSCDSGSNRAAVKDTMTVDTRDLFGQQTPRVFQNVSPKSPMAEMGHDDIARMYFNGPLE